MIELKEEFVALMRETMGSEEGAELVAALDSEPVTGVRFNPRKFSGDMFKVFEGIPNSEHDMADEQAALRCSRVGWCPEGLILMARPQFTLMPEWHGGLFYVQEPASMVIGEVVRRLASRLDRENSPMDRKGLRYLDLCAAPGGKTTAALGALPDDAFVVANEYVPTRANILCENLAKWGSPNTAVCCGDTSAFKKMRECFDIVAVDAPCSGEGMMRKDEEARRQWSEGLVRQCAALQREIVDNAWEALRPGGYLIYSTCTFNRTEDEEMLRYIADELGGESIDTGIGSDFGVPGSLDPDLHALRFMPHRTCGEGLFMGVMRKPGDLPARQGPVKANRRKCKKESNTPVPDLLRRLIKNPENFRYYRTETDTWQAVPRAHLELVNSLREASHVMNAGVALGQTKGKDFVPNPALAMSTAAAQESFPHVEADQAMALRYLRREAVTLPSDTPRGYVLICYRGLPLGFMKHLGNRSNNLYPQPWRIRNR